MSLRLITPPSGYPLTLDEAKAHLREESGEQDSLITALIASATEHVQNYVQRRYLEQTWEWVLQDFGCGTLRVPIAGVSDKPAATINFVKYTDQFGGVQTIDPTTYIVTPYGQQTCVYPTISSIWPIIWPSAEPVLVRFTVGGAVEDISPTVKAAMLMLISHLYKNRDAVTDGRVNQPFEMPFGVAALMLNEAWN